MCWFVNISLEQVLRFFFRFSWTLFPKSASFWKMCTKMTIYYPESGFLFPVLTPPYLCEQRVLISNYQLYATIGHRVWSLMKISRQSSNSYTGVSWSLWLVFPRTRCRSCTTPRPYDPPSTDDGFEWESRVCLADKNQITDLTHTHKNLIVFEKNKRFDKNRRE